jgi:hypothetical protein
MDRSSTENIDFDPQLFSLHLFSLPRHTHARTRTHNSFVLSSVRNGRSPAAAHEKREVHTLKLGVSQMSQALHGVAHLHSYFLFCFKVSKPERVLSSNEAMRRIVVSRTAAVKVTRTMQTVCAIKLPCSRTR